MAKIKVENTEITVVSVQNEDYISLTDMAHSQMQEHIVFRWMSLKSTIEYLGEWEMLYNPNFNCTEFDTIRNAAGSNNFFCLSKHGLSELAQSALWLKLAVMEAHTRTGTLLITSACGLARVSSFCLVTECRFPASTHSYHHLSHLGFKLKECLFLTSNPLLRLVAFYFLLLLSQYLKYYFLVYHSLMFRPQRYKNFFYYDKMQKKDV